jgi:hypothetical protein
MPTWGEVSLHQEQIGKQNKRKRKAIRDQFLITFPIIPMHFIDQRRRPSCWDIVVTNVMISLCLKMGPVLATEGKLHQTLSRTTSRQCVEANGVGAGVSNNGKQTNNGVF